MQPDPRPFQAVRIGMTGVEHGGERFNKDNFYTGPALSLWRCNLTALSQRYNLYFVATREDVAVYQPDFPFQKLSNTPALNIPPTLANDTAAGYIDQERPHGINHLIVGDLGTEEILLVATDSGNIAAYHTKAIEQATKKDPYKFSSNASSDVVGLRAFFSHWVHESAWGLGIHRDGRMIAVSANRPHHIATDDPSAKVTVFAFALTRLGNDKPSESEPAEEQQEWYDWNPAQSDGETPQRDRNFKITLGGEKGHITNIPSVAFFNTPEDPTGSWLLSTDINGMMKLWRIWRGICHASYDCEGTHLGPSMPRQRDSGWLVAALDPSIFRPALSMDQFCGFHRARPAPQYQGHPGESYDITNIVRLKTPGRSQKHPLIGYDSSDEEDAEDQEEASEEWSDEEIEEPDRKRNLVLGLDSLHLPPSEDSLPSSPAQQTSVEPSTQESAPAVPTPETIVATTETTPTENAPINPFLSRDTIEYESDSDEDEDSEEEPPRSSSGSPVSQQTQRTSVEPTVDSSPDQSGQNDNAPLKKQSQTPSKRPRNASQVQNEVQVPAITALQCSQYHVRLINIPKARSPHFFCANMLTQDLPEAVERSHFAALTRLSMMQQIPELGIVIIASQLGRCAVCTLTRNMNNGASGLRVDWILPTRRQEREGHRPRHLLLGIAVAPIQGRGQQQSDDPTTLERSDSETWAKDRTVHGVKTTFDTSILVLDGAARDNSGVNDSDNSDDGPSHLRTRTSSHARTKGKARMNKKRVRRTSTTDTQTHTHSSTSTAATTAAASHAHAYSSSSSSSIASTSSRAFPNLTQNEPWKAVESSRRYRLMLTYLDLTVLTYEFERGVEREDVAGIDGDEGSGRGIGELS